MSYAVEDDFSAATFGKIEKTCAGHYSQRKRKHPVIAKEAATAKTA
jgi:hypothetical protein